MVLPDKRRRDVCLVIDDLKQQMIKGKGPWLAGNVSLEYGGKVIATSDQALDVLIQKTGNVYPEIIIRAGLMSGQKRAPLIIHSRAHKKLFLIVTLDKEEHTELKERIKVDYNIPDFGRRNNKGSVKSLNNDG